MNTFQINLIPQTNLSVNALERYLIAKAEENFSESPVVVRVLRNSPTHMSAMFLVNHLDIQVQAL